MATWNASEHAVLTFGRSRVVVCKPHSDAEGYGHTLEAIVACALKARRLRAPLCFVRTGTDVDEVTQLASRQCRIVPLDPLKVLAWKLRRAVVALKAGAAGPSALLWRLTVAAREAAADSRRSKSVRSLLKRGAGVVRDGAPSVLVRGKLAVRDMYLPNVPFLTPENWNELAYSPLDLTLTETAAAAAERRARAAGIGPGAPIVAIHVRAQGYKATVRSKERAVDFVRGADITTFIPAMTTLTRAGYVVVRLGDPTMPRLDLPGVVDLAHSSERCKLLDVWVVQHSRFMVRCDSGPSLLARLGSVPCLGVNIVDLRTAAVKAIDRFICKGVIDADGAAMSLPAMLRSGMLGASETTAADQGRRGRTRTNAQLYTYSDNSADEIASAVDDMLKVVSGATAPDEAQQRCHEMLVEAAGSGFVGRGHLSAPFARRCVEQAA